MKIVIDSNVLISLLIKGDFFRFINLLQKSAIEFCISGEQINELTDVLKRENFENIFPLQQYSNFFKYF